MMGITNDVVAFARQLKLLNVLVAKKGHSGETNKPSTFKRKRGTYADRRTVGRKVRLRGRASPPRAPSSVDVVNVQRDQSTCINTWLHLVTRGYG